MNLYNLKLFADSARLESMTKAADLNHLSRPAMSQAIRKLEEELGVALLNHQRRTFELTGAGLALLKKSDEIFQAVDAVKAAIKSESPRVGEFRIGCARTLATFTLPGILTSLKEQAPGFDLKVRVENSETLVEKLVNREIDVAFFLGDDTVAGFRQIVTARGRYCLVKPKKLGSDARYAITERRPETERLKVLFERDHHRPLPVFAEIPSWDAIWTWIERGVCGGLIPDFLLKQNPDFARKFTIEYPKVYPYEVKVMFAKNRASDHMIKMFVESCEATAL